MKNSARIRTFAFGGLAVVVIGCGAIYFVFRNIERVVKNAYAVWWVADMVVEYMRSNQNRWPQNWDDLREPYKVLTQKSGQPWTFDELRSRVDVDWKANPESLAKERSFRVIWLKDGTNSHYEGCEPNEIIRRYFTTAFGADGPDMADPKPRLSEEGLKQ